MHELSIALNIMEIATEEAQRQGGSKVIAIHLRLGRLSSVVKDALVGAFELARLGTALEETELKIEDVPVSGYCTACNTTQPVESIQHLCCGVCGTPMPQITSGSELEIVALEVAS